MYHFEHRRSIRPADRAGELSFGRQACAIGLQARVDQGSSQVISTSIHRTLVALATALAATIAFAATNAGQPSPAAARAMRAECAAKGGTISTAGLAAKPHCVLPTRDAGRPCTSSSQCEAGCIAPKSAPPNAPVTGRCKENTEPFGCRALVEDGKAQPMMCVD